MKYIDKILHSWKTVFTYDDIQMLLSLENRDTIKSFFHRGVKEGIFFLMTKGVYVLKKYDRYELATKLQKNSYISFETVLQKEGIVFQDYGDIILLASDNTREKIIGDICVKSFKIQDALLYNPIGLIHRGGYMIASRERALCDRLYLSKGYYFDSLDGVDFQKLEEISQIYNKRVQKEILQLKHHYHAPSRNT